MAFMPNFAAMSLSRWVFNKAGWKYEGGLPAGVRKCVLVAAPHTSNWDFVVARLVFNFLGVNVRMLIKKEAFFWPFGYFLKKMGGLPIDRSKNNRAVDQIAELFNKHDDLIILFTPEGTRRYAPKWKRGFYFAAQEANVPIVLGYVDYGAKIGGIVQEAFHITGDVDADIERIKEFYKDYRGYNPDWGVK